MKLFVSYAGDIICLLPVLNILSSTELPGKFIKNTEQVPKKTTSEFPCPRHPFHMYYTFAHNEFCKIGAFR